MNGFNKTALLATAVSLSIGGAAFAQSTSGSTSITPPASVSTDTVQTPTELTVDTANGVPTAVQGARTLAGSGPMAGWPVYGSDGVQVGSVIDTAMEPDNSLKYIVFAMEDGRQVQMTSESVARIGEDSLEVLVPSTTIAAAAVEGYTAMTASIPKALETAPPVNPAEAVGTSEDAATAHATE